MIQKLVKMTKMGKFEQLVINWERGTLDGVIMMHCNPSKGDHHMCAAIGVSKNFSVGNQLILYKIR